MLGELLGDLVLSGAQLLELAENAAADTNPNALPSELGRSTFALAERAGTGEAQLPQGSITIKVGILQRDTLHSGCSWLLLAAPGCWAALVAAHGRTCFPLLS